MSEQDFTLKQLLGDRDKFADLFNACVFHGKQLLKSGDLKPLPTELSIAAKTRCSQTQLYERYRDVIMKAAFGSCFAVVACENQNEVHYAMPVRNMTYDALNYSEQIKRVAKQHKTTHDLKSGGEYMSGFSKKDRLMPVITLVLYYGKDPWDGPVCLYDMLELDEKWDGTADIRSFLSDYRLNLIDIRHMDSLEGFHTSLQYIFGMLQYHSDKTSLYQYMEQHRDQIRHMDYDSIAALLSLLGEQKRILNMMEKNGSEKEEIDLCKAIDDLIADGIEEGRVLGIEAGRELGIEAGRELGIEAGRELGIEIGEDRMARLADYLLKHNRQDLLFQALSNTSTRRRLFEEYKI